MRRCISEFGSIVGCFGVAASTIYTMPEIQADVVELTFEGGAKSAANPFATGSAELFTLGIDQVSSRAWPQWNDQFDGTGRTQYFLGGSLSGPQSADVVEFGAMIDPATFVGRYYCTSLACPGIVPIGGFSEFDGTGSAFIACRPRSNPDALYWFRIDFTQSGSINYSCGKHASEGEILTVGEECEQLYPCDHVTGDVDGNGFMDLLDVGPFVDALTSSYVCEADIDQNGIVDLLDVQPFVALLIGE